MSKEKIKHYEVTVIRTVCKEDVVRVSGPGMTKKEAKMAAVLKAQEAGLLAFTTHLPMLIKEEDYDPK